MKYLDISSLANMIKNVSEALLFGLDITESEKLEIGDILTERRNFIGEAILNKIS
jgi:hypothetical protein